MDPTASVSKTLLSLNAAILTSHCVTASLTSADSGWIVGQLGESCDAVCEQLSEPFHVGSMRALNTSLSFNRAVAQLGVPNPCINYISSSDELSPSINASTCALAAQTTTECSSSLPTITRLCCCRLDGCKSNANTPWADSGIAVSPPLAYWPFDS